MRTIDADALAWVLKHSKTYHKVIALDVVLDAVRCSPTIDAVSVVHGEWEDRSDGIEGAWNYCSVCGEQAIDLYDFCPNCGAKMDGERGE